MESKKIERSYRILFDVLLQDLEINSEDSYLWKKFVTNKTEKYRETTSPVRMVIDFVSGMTDSHFIRTFERLIVPAQIDLG